MINKSELSKLPQNSELSELPQNFVQFVGYDKSKNHGEFDAELNKKANEYIVIRETLRSAGVPLDELMRYFR